MSSTTQISTSILRWTLDARDDYAEQIGIVARPHKKILSPTPSGAATLLLNYLKRKKGVQKDCQDGNRKSIHWISPVSTGSPS
jgi:hypothetical protein